MVLGFISGVFRESSHCSSMTINIAVVIPNLLLNTITDVQMPHFNIFLTTAYATNTDFFLSSSIF